MLSFDLQNKCVPNNFFFLQDSEDRSQCSSLHSCDGEGETRQNNIKVISDNSDTVFTDDNIKYLENVAKKVEDKIVQDWRRRNRHSAIYDDRPKIPEPPSTSSDIWSLGCLLAECLTGRKLFQTGDKLASVLRPSQLLEMKLGEAEAAWAKKGQKKMFLLVRELILQCIRIDKDTRITAADALNHPVLLQHPSPTIRDLYLLQSPLHQFSLFSNTETKEENEICEELLRNLREECEEYAEISECKVTDGGHAFMTFQEVSNPYIIIS